MMQSWRKALITLCFCAFVSVSASAQPQDGDGDAAAGKERFYTCVGCHGIPEYNNAYPTYHVPKLAGQHATYIEDALKAYRSGDRQHSTMHAQAASLSDKDIKDIAAYLSQQKP
jgi:cytochrome c553